MKILTPIAFLLAGAAVAQTPPVIQARPGAAAPAPRKIPGVSDAGNAILAKAQAAPDPQLSALIRQQRGIHDQLISAVMAPTIDIDKIAAILKQAEALQDQFHLRSNDRLIAAVRLLPEADRGPFLRALLTSVAAPTH